MDIVYTHILWLPSSQDTAAICSIAEACECPVNQEEEEEKKKIYKDIALQKATQ